MNSARILVLTLGALGSVFLLPPLHGGDKKKAEESKGVVVHGALIGADLTDPARPGCFCKTYTFKMKEGRTYQLDMVSTEFDSWLRLENPDGKQVAQDDDSGGALNARIVHRALQSGEYRIIATTFGQMTTGKFTLTVKDLGQAKNAKKEK